jgi:hypothetical protein
MNLRRALGWPLQLGLLCCPTLIFASSAALLEALPAGQGLSGAGCQFTRDQGAAEVVLVVAATSLPDQRSSIARAQVAGALYELDWVYTGDQAPFTYANAKAALSITAREWVDDPNAPACHEQSECEGSFHLAQLQVQLGKQVELLQVKVHCGA